MIEITALAPITLAPGRYRLSDSQAFARKHRITKVLDDDGNPIKGLFETPEEGRGLTFKAGETFGFDGEIHKAIAAKVEVAAAADSVEIPAAEPKREPAKAATTTRRAGRRS